MSKPGLKKNHWTSRVSVCAVVKDARGELGVPLLGGAENGEFASIGRLDQDAVVYNTGNLIEGELLLEVENLPISGLPLYDLHTVIQNCKGPVRLKTVSQGKTLKKGTQTQHCLSPLHLILPFCKSFESFVWIMVCF